MEGRIIDMVEQRSNELHDTEQRALTYLQDANTIPSAPPLADHRLRFRLWHFPAFEAYQSWTVLERLRRREPSAFLVRQVTWDRPFDCRRLRDPLLGLQEGFHTQPKIELRDRTLHAPELSSRLARAQSLAIPVVGRNSGICVDGAIFGYEEWGGSLRLEWCCNGPAEWLEFTTWAGEMMNWLRETCAA
jgi:hypothetical protein